MGEIFQILELDVGIGNQTNTGIWHGGKLSMLHTWHQLVDLACTLYAVKYSTFVQTGLWL